MVSWIGKREYVSVPNSNSITSLYQIQGSGYGYGFIGVISVYGNGGSNTYGKRL